MNIFSLRTVLFGAAGFCGCVAMSAEPPSGQLETGKVVAPAEAKAEAVQWLPLPTGKEGVWEVCNFGGDGDVVFAPKSIVMEMGDPLTGIRLKDKDDEAWFPTENFEIELQARRVNGFDFFCGLTFPVGKDGAASFVLGGWSGGVVGVSSIDGFDASENETTSFMTFENGQWYTVRIRVDDHIRCWIDGKNYAEVERKGHKFTIRDEMEPSLPIGIAAFQVKSELRNLRWRKLEPAAKPKKSADATKKASQSPASES
ncbi:hypothetical protein FF011L_39580 [Roseimaritima multifibrata]|uniref:3-keto-alpha-glucoside-1,2-lyase/3-keto-2-hydroxy-glucal hydratase domain-containing protein n=1 Tax=Roseimaritima multifibrata TaxID=1930274 RepID=A0A517MJV2_9BACT|nr:family 16 glycoside hydrolase [Roseimaritima multifibrata]QDS95171.1 hypothetical protein FF011L_39580 [Roseimaritima multifibrata]